LQANRVEVVLVSDDEIRAAVRALALKARLVAEPTGAVGAAAVLAGKLARSPGARVGVILSGGNVDPALLIAILGQA
jgi:threonine dehydratase